MTPTAAARPIVVTGAAGQLGRQVVRRGGGAAVGFGSTDLDITDPASIAATITGECVVINCAAHTAVDAAETDVENAERLNVLGPRLLAERCAEVGAQLVHVSTDYVFPGDARTPYEPSDPTGPRTVYGRTKLAGERAVLAALPGATVVRTAWVYTGVGTDFVATMLRLERERDTVTVVGDQVGSPTYAADLADGLLEAAGIVGALPPVVHATGGGSASWFDLARAVFEGVGADPERVRPCTSADFPRPAPRPAYSVLSPLSWAGSGLTPLRPWRDALAAALAARADDDGRSGGR
ncbi:dTDP-4-dehydrorhamnose reductase [Rhodococcoides corynebacterioides]|uniref:dTDP-4-dehydrorhamnose reductase n=1 Tax=Rhodococcoides corynebacterioides TaxID=53972 RepID=UPI0027E1FC31|nr:dTDP-4-dehydrorhamnose reductase [Rhodococcus corynebacterioides]